MSDEHLPPKKKYTFWKGFSFAIVFLFFGSLFYSHAVYYALLISLGFAVAIYQDYLKAQMRQKAIDILREKVEAKEDSKKTEAPADTSNLKYDINKYKPNIDNNTQIKTSNTPNPSYDLPIVGINEFNQRIATHKHRFDHLMQYRIVMRGTVSALLVLAIILASGKILLAPSLQFSDGFIMLSILSVCVLLEYNISYLRRQPTAGLFFRKNFAHVPSIMANTQGVEKEQYGLAGNKFGVGSGIYGRPVFGVFLCFCWLITIENRYVSIAFAALFLTASFVHRNRFDKNSPPLHLLELRVFESSSFGRFLELLQAWQYIGVTYRLDGPDTFGHKFSQINPLALKKIDQYVVKNQEELTRRFSSFKTNRSRFFDQYSVNTMQCSDATWELAIKEAIKRCDGAVMLLSGFTAQKTGCTTELTMLAQTYSYEKTILLIDNDTVIPDLAVLLSKIRADLPSDSPNYSSKQFPHIVNIDEIYGIHNTKRPPLVAIKMQLVDYVHSIIAPHSEIKASS